MCTKEECTSVTGGESRERPKGCSRPRGTLPARQSTAKTGFRRGLTFHPACTQTSRSARVGGLHDPRCRQSLCQGVPTTQIRDEPRSRTKSRRLVTQGRRRDAKQHDEQLRTPTPRKQERSHETEHAAEVATRDAQVRDAASTKTAHAQHGGAQHQCPHGACSTAPSNRERNHEGRPAQAPRSAGSGPPARLSGQAREKATS